VNRWAIASCINRAGGIVYRRFEDVTCVGKFDHLLPPPLHHTIPHTTKTPTLFPARACLPSPGTMTLHTHFGSWVCQACCAPHHHTTVAGPPMEVTWDAGGRKYVHTLGTTIYRYTTVWTTRFLIYHAPAPAVYLPGLPPDISTCQLLLPRYYVVRQRYHTYHSPPVLTREEYTATTPTAHCLNLYRPTPHRSPQRTLGACFILYTRRIWPILHAARKCTCRLRHTFGRLVP